VNSSVRVYTVNLVSTNLGEAQYAHRYDGFLHLACALIAVGKI
jgi:hypothetical protein